MYRAFRRVKKEVARRLPGKKDLSPMTPEQLRQHPLPPLEGLHAADLPSGPVGDFFLHGASPLESDDQAVVTRFCIKNGQLHAMAWLYLQLEALAPWKEQRLGPGHTVRSGHRPIPMEHRLIAADDVVSLADWLRDWLPVLQLLTSVDLSGLNIGARGVEALSEVVASNLPLHDLSLRDCSISSQGMKILAEALTRNSELLTLDLSFNTCCNDGARSFGDALRTNKTLRSLDMGNMCLLDPVAVDQFAQGLEQNTGLRHLGCDGMPITVNMIAAIRSHRTLTSFNVDLPSDHDLIKSLLETLRNRQNLKRIRLGQIGQLKSHKEAFLNLMSMPGLEVIDLSSGELPKALCKPVLAALLKNPHIHCVDLSGNDLNGLGAKIADLVTNGTGLTQLRLTNTGLSSDDMKAIRGAARRSRTLVMLELPKQFENLTRRLRLNTRPRPAQITNGIYALEILVNRRHGHNVPRELLGNIVDYAASVGGIDPLIAAVFPLPTISVNQRIVDMSTE